MVLHAPRLFWALLRRARTVENPFALQKATSQCLSIKLQESNAENPPPYCAQAKPHRLKTRKD
eukprot:1593344-Pleurochrysis_carterae.AAC.1